MLSRLEPMAFADLFFQQSLPKIYRSLLQQLRRMAKQWLLFHAFFIASSVFCLYALVRFPVASLCGLFFATLFCYGTLWIALQTRRPSQFEQWKEQFLLSARQCLSMPQGAAEHHLTIARALTDLAAYLDDFESQMYRVPSSLSFLQSYLTSLALFLHQKDLWRFKQILLHAAIEEHLAQLRLTPTDLELHASLASTYVSLAKLFEKQIPIKNKEISFFHKGFHSASQLALQEFHILNDYAPDNPWVHEQLAQGYRALQMPEEEIQALELLLKLRSYERTPLVRLGELYFQQKKNAQGLRVYQELKKANYKQADDLIAEYGKVGKL